MSYILGVSLVGAILVVIIILLLRIPILHLIRWLRGQGKQVVQDVEDTLREEASPPPTPHE